MIIVWGSIEAAEGQLDELKALSLEHVQRSRQEPGCRSHSVQIDAENPNRLIFFEEWDDMGRLQTHFKVPESVGFIEAVGKLCVSPPTLKIYDSTQLQ